jgi:hypothetical protein
MINLEVWRNCQDSVTWIARYISCTNLQTPRINSARKQEVAVVNMKLLFIAVFVAVVTAIEGSNILIFWLTTIALDTLYRCE